MIDSQAQAQIHEFIQVLKKRRWLILLPALFILTLGSAFAAIVPKKYVVETQIEIKPSRVPADYQLRNPHESAAAREVENASQHIKNYNRIKRVIDLDLVSWPEYHRAGPIEQDDLIRTVKDNLEVEVEAKKNSQGSTFVTITYRDPDKGRAALFLNDLREAWLEDVVAWDLTTLKGERDALFSQKSEIEAGHRDLQRRYHELCRELGIDPLQLLARQTGPGGPESDEYYGQLQERIGARDQAKAQLEKLRGELDTTTRLWENEPEQSFRTERDPGIDNAAAIAGVEERIDKLRAEMERLTPQNSKYEKRQREIEQLQQRIVDLEARQRSGGTIEVAVPNERKLEYAAERDRLVAEAAGIEDQITFYGTEIERLRKEVSARGRKYEDLAQVQNKLRLSGGELDDVQADLSRWERGVRLLEEGSGRPYDIAEPAVADTAPQQPNPMIIVAFTGLLGVALGLFFALIVEYGSNSYRTVTELASVMSVPVLGAIEPILTHAELRRAQFRRAMVGFSTAILVGGVAWVTYMYKSAPEKLPVEIQQALDTLELALR